MRPHLLVRPRVSGHGVTLTAFVLTTALIVAGQVMFVVRAGRGAVGASVSAPLHGTGPHRLRQVVASALEGSDRGVRRFTMAVARGSSGRYAVVVRWAINGDLSGGTVGNGAELDVYNVLRGIYEAHVPVSVVRLVGTYPMVRGAGAPRETVVMRLSMSRQEATLVARTGWEVLDPQTVWPLVARQYVNPEFRPIPTD